MSPAKGYIMDRSGQRYGRLIAIKSVRQNRHRQTMWRCECDCGNETIVSGGNLTTGVTKSCGCLRTENGGANTAKRAKERVERGEFTWHKTHEGYMRGHAVAHPLSNKAGQMLEHWHNYWEAHNRANWVVRAKEMGATIHHKNSLRDDNHPENLELRWPGQHPQGWTTEVMIETLEMIGYEVSYVS